MKTPLDTRGSRANESRSARLGKKQPDGTHAHRIAHSPPRGGPRAGGPARGVHAAITGGSRWCGISRSKAGITVTEACARGNQRVSSFALTGGRPASIPHYWGIGGGGVGGQTGGARRGRRRARAGRAAL